MIYFTLGKITFEKCSTWYQTTIFHWWKTIFIIILAKQIKFSCKLIMRFRDLWKKSILIENSLQFLVEWANGASRIFYKGGHTFEALSKEQFLKLT